MFYFITPNHCENWFNLFSTLIFSQPQLQQLILRCLFPTGYITVYPKVLFFVLKVSTNTGASIDFLLAHALPSVPKWRLRHLRFGR